MIKPQIPKGFRDFLPDKMVYRQKLIQIMSRIFESYGYQPLDTPCLEYAETLEGKYGEEGDKLIYKFEDRGGRSVALRYDLTIPLSRVVAMHSQIQKPFKRYQIAPVWRADKPQKGRFREFYQCDVDIIGSDSAVADAELLTIAYDVLNTIGFKNYVIRINNRKVLNALAIREGINTAQIPSFLRSLDKLDKIGAQAVMDEMDKNGILNASLRKRLETLFAGQCAEGLKELSTVRELAAGVPVGDEGLIELETIKRVLDAYGVPESCCEFDITLARGLDYYTGPIFETIVREPKIGSITGGGRYDNLIGMFNKTPLPATGISFGLERIVTVMEEMSQADSLRSTCDVLITHFDSDSIGVYMKMAKNLRAAGLKTEVYYASDKLKKQLSYASARGIPMVVIAGPDEISQDRATIKFMRRGEQVTVACNELALSIKAELSGGETSREE